MEKSLGQIAYEEFSKAGGVAWKYMPLPVQAAWEDAARVAGVEAVRQDAAARLAAAVEADRLAEEARLAKEQEEADRLEAARIAALVLDDGPGIVVPDPVDGAGVVVRGSLPSGKTEKT